MRRFATAALALTISASCLSLNIGQAHAEGVIADPPTTPAKITVKPHPKPWPLIQPPVEKTVYAQPYGLVPRGSSSSNHSFTGLLDNAAPVGAFLQPARYSLFYKSEKVCDAQLDKYGKSFGILNVMVPQHFVWMAENDWVENVSNKCYQIFNGMWVYEYINHFESPGIKDIEGVPGRYPKDVPPEQKKYLRK